MYLIQIWWSTFFNYATRFIYMVKINPIFTIFVIVYICLVYCIIIWSGYNCEILVIIQRNCFVNIITLNFALTLRKIYIFYIICLNLCGLLNINVIDYFLVYILAKIFKALIGKLNVLLAQKIRWLNEYCFINYLKITRLARYRI